MTVEDLAFEQLRDVELEQLVDGRIVLARGALQELGLFDGLLTTSIAGVGAVAGIEAAEQLAATGVERLHDVCDPLVALDVQRLLTSVMSDVAAASVRAISAAVRTPRRGLYAELHAYVRLMMPEDALAPQRELLSDQLGHMVAHNPHRDSWFSHCRNSINIWMAVGPVSHGNGLLLYPSLWGERLARERTGVSPSQAIGVPVGVTMAPGDVLLFSGEHLHSSEVNITDDTRVAISARFTYGAPRYGDGAGWVPYHDLRLVGSRLERMASARSRLTSACIRRRRRAGS